MPLGVSLSCEGRMEWQGRSVPTWSLYFRRAMRASGWRGVRPVRPEMPGLVGGVPGRGGVVAGSARPPGWPAAGRPASTGPTGSPRLAPAVAAALNGGRRKGTWRHRRQAVGKMRRRPAGTGRGMPGDVARDWGWRSPGSESRAATDGGPRTQDPCRAGSLGRDPGLDCGGPGGVAPRFWRILDDVGPDLGRPGTVTIVPGLERRERRAAGGGKRDGVELVITGLRHHPLWATDVGFVPRTRFGQSRPLPTDGTTTGTGWWTGPTGCIDGRTTARSRIRCRRACRCDVLQSPTLAELQGMRPGRLRRENVTGAGRLVVTRVTSEGCTVRRRRTGAAGATTTCSCSLQHAHQLPDCQADEQRHWECSSQEAIVVRPATGLGMVMGSSESSRVHRNDFPSWRLIPGILKNEVCPVPDPATLTGDRNGKGPSRGGPGGGLSGCATWTCRPERDFVYCDLNATGRSKIPRIRTNSAMPSASAGTCVASPLCLELTQYWQYEQWPVRVGGSGAPCCG
jgi:hypothetical protein